MRALILTKIFPNRLEPHSSPFNRQQFRELARLCDVELLATIPWFPAARGFARWSRAGRLEGVPRRELIDELRVLHPRYAYLPKIGGGVAGPLYALSLAPHVLRHGGNADVLLGSWAYPDGYAAVVLARVLGIPCVVKVHGSDINVLGRAPRARQRLAWTLSRATRVVAVSRALAAKATELGAHATVVQNGVDPAVFYPRDAGAARAKLGLGTRPAVLYVGRLTREKGVPDLVRAFARPELRQADLWLIGEGDAKGECQALAGELGVRLVLFGEKPHREVPDYLAAANLLALPSLAEGSPNVVSEALASGRPVVATNVGGIPELVTTERLGELVPPRAPEALGRALARALGRDHDARAITREAQIPSWRDSARELHRVLLDAARTHGGRAAA